MGGEFADRVAIVTGSSKGIGLATAERLARGGASVAINSRHEDQLQRVAERLRAVGGDVFVAPGNLTRAGGAEALVDATVAHFGRVDLLVNTVALNTSFGSLLDVDFDAFSAVLVRNTWPTLALAQAAVAAGLGEGGAIVAVSTIGSHSIQPEVAPYCASKAALEVLVRNLAYELGPRGIRVNAVAPGLVVTEMSRALWDGGQEEHEAALLPLGRLGQPDDIAAAICFLLSPASAWTTGQVLDVDGGRLLFGHGPARLLGGVGPQHAG
ncbi:MAG: 3-oxoacyl-[acyl-carrier protein] reductase [Mucilaginibacter sp.]|nr:3-oxoacyl-[acyl-carrier protein] reductase [Mucilaginibacter sp.]